MAILLLITKLIILNAAKGSSYHNKCSNLSIECNSYPH